MTGRRKVDSVIVHALMPLQLDAASNLAGRLVARLLPPADTILWTPRALDALCGRVACFEVQTIGRTARA